MKKYYYVVVAGEAATTFFETESEYNDHITRTREYNGSLFSKFTKMFETEAEAIDAADLGLFEHVV